MPQRISRRVCSDREGPLKPTCRSLNNDLRPGVLCLRLEQLAPGFLSMWVKDLVVRNLSL